MKNKKEQQTSGQWDKNNDRRNKSLKLDKITHCSIFITGKCNLACNYCYRENRDRTMSLETGRKAIDFLLENCPNNLSINFFGGEPLVEFSFLKELVDYARESVQERNVKLSFSINTNGTLIDNEILEFLRKQGFGIILSIDGLPEAHDLNRVFPGGEGSFEIIREKLPIILKPGNRVHARMTVTPETSRFLFEGMKFLYESGFKSAAAAIDRTSEGWDDVSWTCLANNYNRILDWYVDLLRKGEQFYLVDLDFGAVSLDYPFPQRGMPCGAGTSGIAVGLEGKIYPCYRFAGMEGSEIGDVDNGFLKEKRDMFRSYSCYRASGCENCPLNYRCHRCPWVSQVLTGDMFKVVEINCIEAELMLGIFRKFKNIMEKEKNRVYLKRKEQIVRRFFG